MSDKKKKSDFLSFLNKKAQKAIVFDENYFDFTLSGGEFQTQSIVAEGKAKESNEKVTLQCNWFQLNGQSIIKLEKIISHHFQPSVDDIDTKFMVQAVPVIEGKNYEGMPKQLEVGPLKMDPQLQEQINELLEKEMIIFQITIIRIIKSSKEEEVKQNLELPTPCEITLNLSEIKLDLKQNEETVSEYSAKLNAQFPCYEVLKETADSIILHLDGANCFEVKSQDHIQRDLLLVAIKSSYGKSLCLENNSDSEVENSKRGSKDIVFDQTVQQFVAEEEEHETIEIIANEVPQQIEDIVEQQEKPMAPDDPGFKETLQSWKERERGLSKVIEPVKLGKSMNISSADRAIEVSPVKKKKEKMNVDLFVLVNENAKLKEDNQSLTDSLKKEQENSHQLQKKVKELQDQLGVCTKNFYDVDTRLQEQKKLVEGLGDQKVFLSQDLNMFKGQCGSLKEQIERQRQEIDVLQKRNRKSTFVTGLNEAHLKCEELELQVTSKSLEVVELKRCLCEFQEKKCEFDLQLESLENELLYERRKYESLCHERDLQISQQKQQEKKQPKFASNVNSISNLDIALYIKNDAFM